MYIYICIHICIIIISCQENKMQDFFYHQRWRMYTVHLQIQLLWILHNNLITDYCYFCLVLCLVIQDRESVTVYQAKFCGYKDLQIFTCQTPWCVNRAWRWTQIEAGDEWDIGCRGLKTLDRPFSTTVLWHISAMNGPQEWSAGVPQEFG